jgi:hypothetical protein
MTNQYEVDQANFAGRLHPSQRHIVLRGISIGVFLTAAGVVVLVLAFTTLPFRLSGLLDLIPVYALLAWGLWLTLRRVLDVTGARVVAVTGWTGEEIAVTDSQAKWHPEYGKRSLEDVSRNFRYDVRIGGGRFSIDKELFNRTSTNCTNTLFYAPRTKRVLNIARTPT